MDAPSMGEFWKEVTRLIDPAPNPISVTADSLRDVFERRPNPPTILPASFDEPRSTACLLPQFLKLPRTQPKKKSSRGNVLQRTWNGSRTTFARDSGAHLVRTPSITRKLWTSPAMIFYSSATNARGHRRSQYLVQIGYNWLPEEREGLRALTQKATELSLWKAVY